MKLRPMFLGLALAAIGGCKSESTDTPYVPPSAQLPTATVTLTAAGGGTATSKNGQLQLTIGPAVLAADATFTITEGVRSPAPPISVGPAYEIKVSPANAVPAMGFNAELAISVTATQLGSVLPTNLAVATGDTLGDPVSDLLFGSFDVPNNRFTTAVTHFSYFALLDYAAYSACACDTGATCQTGCEYCDLDCAVTCSCDTSAGCESSCSCDPDCLNCTCDVSASCDPSCSCDEDCGSTCSCDVSAACDSNCDCDIDCYPDTPGVYPYADCSTSGTCTAGTCMMEAYCMGTCMNNPASCGSDFTCIEGFCLKSCTGDAQCTSSGDCCVDYTCYPADRCPPPTPVEWTCDPYYYGTEDGCDCGCGAADPDCAGQGCTAPSCQAAGCEFCYDAEGNGIPCA